MPHPIEFESESIQYEDAIVTLHKIKSISSEPSSFVMHSHSYFELLLVTNGTYTCHTAHGDITAKKGELIIVAPTLPHRAFCAEHAPHMAVLGIEVSAPQGKGRFYTYFTSFLQANAGKPLPLGQSFFHKFLHYYLVPARHSLQQLCARKREACDLLSAFWELSQQEESISGEPPTTAPDIVLETLVHSKNIPLSEIAARLGYSARQVQRKIRQRYGKSLREIRREI